MEKLKAYFLNIDTQLFNHVSGKPKEFIDLFRGQHFLTEKAFAQAFCREKYNEKYYSDIRSRTLKILQALAIVSDAKRDFLVNKNFYKCQKKFFLGQKMLMRGQREEGIRLIKQAYQLAVDFDFMHMACELASILQHDHVYYNCDKRLSKYYAERVKYFLNNYTAEKELAVFCTIGLPNCLLGVDRR